MAMTFDELKAASSRTKFWAEDTDNPRLRAQYLEAARKIDAEIERIANTMPVTLHDVYSALLRLRTIAAMPAYLVRDDLEQAVGVAGKPVARPPLRGATGPTTLEDTLQAIEDVGAVLSAPARVIRDEDGGLVGVQRDAPKLTPRPRPAAVVPRVAALSPPPTPAAQDIDEAPQPPSEPAIPPEQLEEALFGINRIADILAAPSRITRDATGRPSGVIREVPPPKPKPVVAAPTPPEPPPVEIVAPPPPPAAAPITVQIGDAIAGIRSLVDILSAPQRILKDAAGRPVGVERVPLRGKEPATNAGVAP